MKYLYYWSIENNKPCID